ncbi:MAG: GNAT family N-acetyltransferase [Bacteroidales bacterium]
MDKEIRYLTNDSINRSEWDEWLRKAGNRRIYASSVFLDTFSPRWHAVVIDDGRAFMPLTWNRKFGVSYLFQPIFVQQLGCFFTDDSYMRTVPVLIEKVSQSFRFVDIALNEMNGFDLPGFHLTGMSNYVLRLDKPYDSLAGDYNLNTRRNINKSGKLGTELLPCHSPSDIIRMFVRNRGKIYSGIRKINYKRLQLLLEKGMAGGFISIRAARSPEGEIIAAACFLTDYDRYVFYFSANTPEGKRHGAMFLLIDSFVRQYADTGMLMDFNGSVNPGVARFYEGFGAEKISYPRLKINRLGFPLRYIKK